jgi:hypothetical protein
MMSFISIDHRSRLFSGMAGYLLVWLMMLLPAVCRAETVEPLWISFSPPVSATAPDLSSDWGHGNTSVSVSRSKGARPGHESEHRPTPLRKYWLNTSDVSPDAKAYVLRPDGSFNEISIQFDKAPSISFKTPLGDGPIHGANYVYVVDRKVANGALVIRVAKWLTIHHRCGWGHQHRVNAKRMTSLSLTSVPFDMVINGLWDGNFHSKVMSGDRLDIKVLYNNLPVQGARVSFTTEEKWTKEEVTGSDGIASMQLIRDYYPAKWSEFKKDKKNRFKVVAKYETKLEGMYLNQPYDRVQLVATFPWLYYPARTDYSSYSYGLLIGTFSLGMGGAGIYAYRERRKRPFKEIVFDE